MVAGSIPAGCASVNLFISSYLIQISEREPTRETLLYMHEFAPFSHKNCIQTAYGLGGENQVWELLGSFAAEGDV